MSLESHAQSVEDVLVESLQFKLHHGASYATDRKSVSYFPLGGNSYAPQGVKVIKISVNGDAWLDPSTVKLFYDIQNTTTISTNPNLRPMVSGAWFPFRRMRVICGGQILEDIDNYNRLHEMFDMMKSSNKRDNDAIEGFGRSNTLPVVPDNLAKDASRSLCFTPMSGILKQKKYLPIKFCPLQFEFELASTATDVLSIGGTHESADFAISNVQLKCDLVQLDSGLDSGYATFLLDGHNIPINFSTFTTASQLITDINPSVNVQRTFTRLKSVFVSLSSDATTN